MTHRGRSGAPLRIEHLSKAYGTARVVDDVSFVVEPGAITGFLGPNGAGKSTTFRLVMGLERPTSGRVLVDGRPLEAWPSPGRKIAAVLTNRFAHPRRTAHDHLRWVAQLLEVDAGRCQEVLAEVGLDHAADTRVGAFSLGMTQRLALATALLGDPEILLLDEPMNGLDPEGITWLKQTLRRLRDDGRTVVVASHLLKETEDLVDRVVILAGGEVVADGGLAEVVEQFERTWVVVRVDDPDSLADAVRDAGGDVRRPADGDRLEVAGLSLDAVGAIARDRSLAVRELTLVRDLSSAYHEATRRTATLTKER